MDNKIITQLSRLFRARFPYVYITTWEEERAIVLDAGSIYYQYVSDNLLNPDIYSEKVNIISIK